MSWQSDNNARTAKYLKNAGVPVPARYADGGAVKTPKKGSTNVTINIGKGSQQPDHSAALAAMAAPKPPLINPQPAAPMPPPGPPMGGGMPPMPGGPPGMPPMPGMARGGKASYPIEDGALSGPGRIEKTISQAGASKQSQPVTGKILKKRK